MSNIITSYIRIFRRDGKAMNEVEIEFEAFKKQKNIHFLDGNLIEVDGLVLGGVSGIIGDKNKPFRVPELKYLQNLEKVVNKRPELLLLHESPEHDDHWGNSEIRKILEKSMPVSVFCGHSHWKKVAAEYPNGCKIYNIDSRVIILHRNKKDL